jgi:hypothetical protein
MSIVHEKKEFGANDIKAVVSEELFPLIQLKLMEPAEGVNISTMATAITDEIITGYGVDNKLESKKAI